MSSQLDQLAQVMQELEAFTAKDIQREPSLSRTLSVLSRSSSVSTDLTITQSLPPLYIPSQVTNSSLTSSPISYTERYKPYIKKSLSTNSPISPLNHHGHTSTHTTQHSNGSAGSNQPTYKIGKLIGQGNSCQVRQISLVYSPTIYAAKIIPLPQDKTKLKREVDILHELNKLNHPNLIKMWDTFTDYKNLFIVMDYCQGGELYDYLKKHRLSLQQVQIVLFRITHVISILHSLGIVHRDVKTENILLKTSHFDPNEIALVDFSMSKREFDSEISQTLPTICGTQGWMAPELIVENRHYTHSIDLWALGVLAFNLITNTMPFEDANIMQEHKNVIAASYTFPPLSQEYDLVKDWIGKMLLTNPSSRMSALEALNHPFLAPLSHLHLSTQPIQYPIPNQINLARTASTFGSINENAVRNMPWDGNVGGGRDVGLKRLATISSPVNPSNLSTWK